MPNSKILNADRDSKFTANSDYRIPSQKAVKTAIDAIWSALQSGMKLTWESQYYTTQTESSTVDITLDKPATSVSDLMVLIEGKTLVPNECLSLNSDGTVLTITNSTNIPLGLVFEVKRARISVTITI